jgi:hypothetical protein
MRSALIVLVISCLAVPRADAASSDPINAVLGDASWTLPGDPAAADETARIRVHLTFVRELLAGRDTSGLSASQQALRTAALADLERYTARGEFPRRTGDAYAGRHPRFIDDRGVHCAVGQLIADSGDPALAREIADNFEYAYVPDIASPALFAWATEHGFTITELAMIQPGYRALPTREGTKRHIHDEMDRITITCAALGTPIRVDLKIRGDSDGAATATTIATDAFSTCFAAEASKLETGGGAYMGSPDAYSFEMSVTPPSIQKLFEAAFASGVPTYSECLPQPGIVPKRATYKLTSSAARLEVDVVTSPVNAVVEECLESTTFEHMQRAGFGAGSWTLALTRTQALTSFAAGNLTPQNLHTYATEAITACYPEHGAPSRVTVFVSARIDDPGFSISLDAKDAEFVACAKEKLGARLREVFTVNRDKQRYFRIDGDLKVTAIVKPMSPAAVKKEYERIEKEIDRQRYGM